MAAIGKHLWAPHKAQRKQETMYHLRRLIRDRGIAVDSGLRSVENGFGGEVEPLMDEALRSKCPEDGQNLLMYAAAEGNEAWFIRLVGEIRSRLGIGALVQMLREIDIDGAPLLFHAASSRREHTCFRTAYDLMCMVLGKGGVRQQVEAVDGLGRGIVMHAARSNHVHTFTEVLAMRKEGIGGMSQGDHAEPTAPVAAGATATTKQKNAALLLEADIIGMNCLHHAAEAGCFEVLQEVLSICKRAEGFRQQDTYTADKTGRTPIMLVLRNSTRCGDGDLKKKFDTLFEALPPAGERNWIGWMTPRAVPSQKVLPNGKGIETRAITELMHAARGGLPSLKLALSHPLPSSKENVVGGFTVNLDKALAVEIKREDGTWGQSAVHETQIWGRALLLAAAAKLGDVDVLYYILGAIEEGKFSPPQIPRPVNDERIVLPGDKEVQKAIDAISSRHVSVVSYAIISGQTEAVEAISDLIVRIFGEDKKSEAWRIISGHANESSSLTCAASASMEADMNGLTMYDVVFSLLQKQVERHDEEVRQQLVYDLLSPRESVTHEAGKKRVNISPLVGAAFSSNWVLFREVYDSYEKLTKQHWSRKHVLAQIPSGPPRRRSVVELLELHECQDEIPPLITRGAWNIPAVMWRDIVKAYKRAQPASDSAGSDATEGERVAEKKLLRSWRNDFKGYSRRAVEVAAERGTFAALRDLVHEGFPLHEDHIPAILENIGDHEQDVIETILAAVANASNPFAMGAGVSRTLRTSEVDHPMHQKSLRRLQSTIDEFTNELLDKLPHTVRGMGVALLGGHQPIDFGEGLQQGKRHRLGNLAGFIVVQWMLEPHLLVGGMENEHQYKGPVFTDPLRRALDRGSKGLDLINSPLVLDYIHVKFTGTLPPWTSRNPFQPTINEGFYKYEGFDEYSLKEVLSAKLPPEEGKSAALTEKFFSISFLLRLLQGWDHTDSALKWNIPVKGDTPVTEGAAGADRTNMTLLEQRKVPHSTMLPGLQFSLAGILGKPETYYQVPVVRFIFEIFGYMVMLGMFCSSVLLKEHDVVPFDERIFYVFTAGMLCREILEFRDNIPARRHKPPRKRITKNGKKIPRISCRGTGQRFNRMVSAFTRYVFYDTWNFLDTSTICCILVAFIFRMVAVSKESLLFHAQFFYALSAPLLFSRLLVLSQIDATLGPMTQVIWRMMSHTLRFSAFIAMVMLSFALAFHAVFHTCGTWHGPSPSCDEEPEESSFRDAFGTFGNSFVTVFSSALGGPDFDIFKGEGSECYCDLPDIAKSAGEFLMVVYMITMSVVLLNLLIAVLSTAHDQVYANAEKEFHLARARLIYQSAHVVSSGRPPPPLNLLKVVCGLLVDTGTEVWRLCLWVSGEKNRDRAKKWQPASTTHKWKTFEGALQRWAFAWTLGAAAVVLSTVLWILSIPWVAWCLLRWARPVEKRHPSANSVDGNDEQQYDSTKWERDEEAEEKSPPGYFWTLYSMIKAFVFLLIAILVAGFLCFFYIYGSILLWILGICRVGRWLRDNWAENDRNIPEAMPGQEKTYDHWRRAWQLARLRNSGIREEGPQAHFHVLPLLKSKTGLDMQHLARLSKARDAKSKSEQELVDVDRNLPDARIDIEHLLLMAKSRAEQRRKDSNTNSTPAAQPPVTSISGGGSGSGGGSTGDRGETGDGGGGGGGTNGGGGGAGRADSDAGDAGGRAGAIIAPIDDPTALGGSVDGDDAPLQTPAPAFTVGTMSPQAE